MKIYLRIASGFDKRDTSGVHKAGYWEILFRKFLINFYEDLPKKESGCLIHSSEADNTNECNVLAEMELELS